MIKPRYPYPLPCLLALCCVLSTLAGCRPVQAPAAATQTTVSTPAADKPATATPAQVTIQPSLAPTVTAAGYPAEPVCPPFDGWTAAQLTESISNPFHPPAPGSDDPHQGVDFSDLDPAYGYAREGLPVQTVLAGTVAGVIAGRFPYGNALMIETPVDALPAELLARLSIPGEFAEPAETTVLTCPPGPELRIANWEAESVYLLYAHLQVPPELRTGEFVACGQPIGVIGSSGNALSPHLHIEARAGLAGQQFSGMAHYDVSASEIEMANYCAWRVSGAFALLDPMAFVDFLP